MGIRFELPSELNIYSALETRDALLAWVSEQASRAHQPLEVCAGNVAEVDGAGLQLLAALTNMGHPWHLVQASPAFRDACHILGYDQWLDKRYLQDNSAPNPSTASTASGVGA